MSSVLITGCSSGFGLLTALKFARRGHTVFATVRDLSGAGSLKAARDAESLPISILELDVCNMASVQPAVSAALDAGPIDIVINNAGFALRGAVEEIEPDEMLRQFDTNVFGAIRVVQAVAPTMRERRSGTIVNVSSVVAVVPQPFSGLYAASKAALSALSEALYSELAPFGVRVILVEPGPYPTQLNRSGSVSRGSTPASPYAACRGAVQAAAQRLASGVTLDPQEVADAIYDAVYAEMPKFRHVVGDFARRIVTLRQGTEFEEFDRRLKALIGQST